MNFQAANLVGGIQIELLFAKNPKILGVTSYGNFGPVWTWLIGLKIRDFSATI
jgi:hypothetical protein